MKIADVNYSILTMSLDIYLSGCKGPHCEGCHNPELHSFSVGVPYNQNSVEDILDKIKQNELLIQNVFVMGGEPLDQDEYNLRHLLRGLKQRSNKNIYLFTGKQISDVPNNIKHYTDYIKCGRYKPEKYFVNEQYGVELQSSNQEIYKKGVDY